eukprot:69393_1
MSLKLNRDSSKLQGCMVIAQALKDQGVKYIFGIVGIPVTEIALCAQMIGIKFIGMRNEQAASYAAGAVGYMTGTPGVCLTVSGPGVIHAIAGLANAWSNCWPMLLLGGACEREQTGKGAFQEAPQMESVAMFTKYRARPNSISRIPFFVEQALRTASYGRPGPAYLDLPADLIVGCAPKESVNFVPRSPPPPLTLADPSAVRSAIMQLKSARAPLIIVGKGCAQAQAEIEVRSFVERAKVPFLASPMGKGVVPDDHPLSCAPARSTALAGADVVVLLGARLNWIMHFGEPPRFRPGMKLIQLDISAEELSSNVQVSVGLCGHAKAVVAQLDEVLKEDEWSFPSSSEWWTTLNAAIDKNVSTVAKLMDDDRVPMSYYRVFKDIEKILPSDAIIVSEGANTMDIGRTIMKNRFPRHRLDAGSFGTMGVGLGFAIAAAEVHPDKKIVCVEGDSAFGFSGMEYETVCRYHHNITFVVVNNNGIYSGQPKLPDDRYKSLPTSLSTNARYEKITEMFGGNGFFVTRPSQLLPSLKEAIAHKGPSVVNVIIRAIQQRKKQKFEWLTKSDNQSKL